MSVSSTAIVLGRCTDYAHTIIGSECTVSDDSGAQYINDHDVVNNKLSAADYIRTLNHWVKDRDLGSEPRQIIQRAINFTAACIIDYDSRPARGDEAIRGQLYRDVKDLLLQYRDELDCPGSQESIVITWREQFRWWNAKVQKIFS